MPDQGCGIEIEWYQVEPHPSYREVIMKTTCGTTQTDVHGDSQRRFCTPCLRQYQNTFPQGWATYPGDRCRHGTYKGGIAEDWECGYCLQEEQEDAESA